MDSKEKLEAKVREVWGKKPDLVVEPEKPIEPEKPVEPDKQVVVPEKTEPVVVDKRKVLSEYLGQEFDDDEKATEYVSSLKERYERFDTVEKELETIRKRNEELESGIDPETFFVNKNEYHRQLMLKQFPDYDPEILTKITVGTLDNLTPIEIIALKMQLKDSDIYKSKDSAIKIIHKNFGYDPDIPFEEQEETTRLEILKAAKDAKNEFSEIKGKVSLPERINVAEKKEKEKRDLEERLSKYTPLWKSAFRNMPEEVKAFKFEIPVKTDDGEVIEVLDFGVEPEFIEKLKKEIPAAVEVLAKNGVELTKENEKKIVGGAKEKVFSEYFGNKENITKLLIKFRNELHSKWTEQSAAADAGVPDVTGRERPEAQKESDFETKKTGAMKDYLKKKQAGQV